MTPNHGTPPTPDPRSPRWRRRAALAALATIGLLAGPVLPPSPAAATGPEGRRSELPTRQPYAHERLAPSLRDDLAASEAQPAGRAASRSAAPSLTVVVQSTDLSSSRAAISEAGGTVADAAGDLLQADVPAASLGALADSPASRTVRQPFPARPQAVTSEGAGETGATAWGGSAGTGTKVAIVDVGFAGYLTKLGTELPVTVESDFSRCGGPGAFDHGTAVAEVVHDEAPGATLMLVCVETDVEFASALATLAGAGVHVVNGSIGFTVTGRGDGSGGPGSPAAAVAALRGQGVLYVAAAGNYGLTHWNFPAVGDSVVQSDDPNIEFADLVDIDGDDVLGFVVAPFATVQVAVSWDEWPTAATDFDAYAASESCPTLFGSAEDQTTQAVEPIEYFEVTNCTGAFEVFNLYIDRYNGTASPRMDVFFDGPVAAVERSSGSGLPEPASSPAAFTVGAYCYANGSIEPYSSRGPTIDGRTKPDIAGPDGITNSVAGAATGTCEGGFAGTSASAPHVAGAAANLRSANPALDVAELQQLLEDRALDSGPVGKDVQFGSGRLRLGTAGSAPAPTPRRLTAMTPLRLFDSRPDTIGAAEAAFGPQGRTTPLGANGEVAVQVAGIAGVPADATAVVLNVTVTSPTAQGWITVHPGGAVPNASNVNFVANQTTAAHVTATVGTDGKVRFFNSHGNTHLVVDISGWYGPTGSGNAGFTGLAAPSRAFDSRSDTFGFAEGAFGGSGRTTALGPNEEVQVQLAGLGGIPAEATAVAVNLTVTSPTAQGWFTIFPTGSARPNASTLNFVPGLTLANLSVMPVGAGGKVTIANSHGSSHAVLDVIGYYLPGSGAGYVALDPPTRNLDSRTGTGPRFGPLGPGGTYRLPVARRLGVPARATAVVLNVVAVSPTKQGWFTVYPGGAGLPNASNLNFTAGAVVPNAVIAGLGGDGTVAITNAAQGGNTHVVADLAGYFVNP